ncbi:hypothetical protein K435DRAFT_859938 [Dendrothele bispora CBS 962.96]|uniref:DUF6534 domain-containing protein n=1 Tax=Dendrothele bispora (strain CBS 962.96) TaxID=1314807 RepID=A0A4S8LZ95_DENBC|nr:hypothetical protein K435DRAFT_859938 [Dendrothele bispora CBS 962.96]
MTIRIFGWRIFKLSKNNYLVSAPVFILAVIRLVAAAVSSGEMLHLRTFQSFRDQFMWLFSLGLSISVSVDVYITTIMFIILKRTREKSLTLNPVIDSLVIYTLENGLMTSVVTVASLICWVTMDNLVFLGLHFIVSKLYANSTLAVFNYRVHLRYTHEQNLNMRANTGGIELVVLPSSPVGVSPNDESSRVVCRPNFEGSGQGKELEEETEPENPDLPSVNEGRDMALNGVMKSVTVHFHRD